MLSQGCAPTLMGGPSVGQVVQQGGCWFCSAAGVALPVHSDRSTLASVGSASVPLAHRTGAVPAHTAVEGTVVPLCCVQEPSWWQQLPCVEAPVLPSLGWIGIDECLIIILVLL